MEDIQELVKLEHKIRLNKEAVRYIKLLQQNPDNDEIKNQTICALVEYLKFANILSKDENSVRIKAKNQYDSLSNKLADNITLRGYFNKLITDNTCKKTNLIRITQRRYSKNWSDVFEGIGMTNKQTQQKFKNFLIDHDLVRKRTIDVLKTKEKHSVFIINPFKIRRDTMISRESISVFADGYLNPFNVDKMLYELLKLDDRSHNNLCESKDIDYSCEQDNDVYENDLN